MGDAWATFDRVADAIVYAGEMVIAWSALVLTLASPAIEPTFTPDLRPVTIPERSAATGGPVVLLTQLRDPFAPAQGSARSLPQSVLKDPFRRGETDGREAANEGANQATQSALVDPFQVQRRSTTTRVDEPLKNPFDGSQRLKSAPPPARDPSPPTPAPLSADAPAPPESAPRVEPEGPSSAS